MRYSAILLGLSVLSLSLAGLATDAIGQSMTETLENAYTQSTQLQQQRAQQRATDELVPQALSNWRPTVSVNGNVTRNFTQYGPSTLDGPLLGNQLYGTSKAVGVQVTQNIYRGGRTTAQTNQATNQVKAGQSQLKSTEQNVLLAAAQAYLDVVRDQATLELNINNEAVLKRQLDAEEDRFRVGEVTRTDVALSQASYQQARSQHTAAIGQLETSRSNYQRVVGQLPGKLLQPVFTYKLPGSMEDAVAEAEANNPTVVAAEYAERAARDAVDLAEGERLPTIQIVGTFGRQYPAANTESQLKQFYGATYDHLDTGSIAAQMTWPLYTGGLTSSQVRQAKHTANQNLIAIEDAKRVARQSAISAWQQLSAARATIEALTAQVTAAQIGAEGTRQQALVGTSTVLDSLTAEQNLLQAQVSLVSAQHDALLDSFVLLSAVGRLNATELGLAVKIYDPQENQDRVKDKWMGTGVD